MSWCSMNSRATQTTDTAASKVSARHRPKTVWCLNPGIIFRYCNSPDQSLTDPTAWSEGVRSPRPVLHHPVLHMPKAGLYNPVYIFCNSANAIGPAVLLWIYWWTVNSDVLIRGKVAIHLKAGDQRNVADGFG